MKVGDKTFKVHLDGYNVSDAFAGKAPSPRKEFFYFNDEAQLVALRFAQWKLVFAEQRSHGMDVWQDPFVTLRIPSRREEELRSRDSALLGEETQATSPLVFTVRAADR